MKWEYITRSRDFMGGWELNELGNQGWELVSHSIVHQGGAFGKTSHYYTFKRKKG